MWLRRVGLGFFGFALAWGALILHPRPLFAHTLVRGNLALHARAPLPPEAAATLDDALARVARSPLYDPTRTHDIYLCDTPACFAFFTLWDHRSGGVTHDDGNVFLRPSNVARGRVIGPSGDEKQGERTLAYYIAHEVTHSMTVARLGIRRMRRLAAFQREGYADYVAMARPLDLPAARAALQRGDPEMSPARSGLYKRYELLVAYLIERCGESPWDVLASPRRPADVEARLLADPL